MPKSSGSPDVALILGTIVLLAFLLAGLGVIGWQVISWLREGVWTSVSVLDFVAWGGSQNDWVRNPTSWVGLWRLIGAFPLSVFFIGLGLIGGLAIIFDSGGQRRL